MKKYNIKITFTSKCNEDDLIDDEYNFIYNYINQNFWNVENFKYKYEKENEGE
jgi:hypothetical protein